MKRLTAKVTSGFSAFLIAGTSHGFFLDGQGYYGLLGETRIAPDFQKDNGTYQATQVFLDLNGEIKANDRASLNLRLGLSNASGNMNLGDDSRPKTCEPRRSTVAGESSDNSCVGRNQSIDDVGYNDISPIIREAYASYAFNYCILTAGRRSRDIGLGALYSSGKTPFSSDASVFDGVTCDVNIQKQQDLGFTFGADKLQETGSWIDNPFDRPVSDSTLESDYAKRSAGFGTNDPSDDMEQIFFGITYDDLRTKNPGSFAKQVQIYFSNMLSSDSKTDVKFFDLYTAFFYGKFSLKNELIFRLGKSAEPALVANGGQRSSDGNPSVNNVNSIGVAGTLEYTLAQSGAALGPEEFNEGSLRRHLVFADYAYAPGDSDGYYIDRANETSSNNDQYGESRRDNRAKAMAFHRNYHPALLFFNGHQSSQKFAIGGVYNPERLMNATLYSLGYRYENMESGTIEVKGISGRLLETVPTAVRTYYGTSGSSSRPIGFYGEDLGYEVDFNYTYRYQREVDVGIGLAAAMPGKAWQASSTTAPQMGFGLLGSFAIKF